MKALKWIGVLLLVLAIVFVAGALLITPTWTVERSTTVNAPAAKVYPLIAAPKEWPRWTVWHEREPGLRMSFAGPEAGKGAKWQWQGKDGRGEMEFTEVEPDRRVRYRLAFPDMGMESTGTLALTPAGDATKITWTQQGDMGWNLLNRWFVPFLDGMMGPDFEANLAKLKALAEKGA